MGQADGVGAVAAPWAEVLGAADLLTIAGALDGLTVVERVDRAARLLGGAVARQELDSERHLDRDHDVDHPVDQEPADARTPQIDPPATVPPPPRDHHDFEAETQPPDAIAATTDDGPGGEAPPGGEITPIRVPWELEPEPDGGAFGEAVAPAAVPGNGLVRRVPALPMESLVRRPRLRAALMEALSDWVPSGRIDARAAVRSVARQKPVTELPRRLQRRVVGPVNLRIFDKWRAPFTTDLAEAERMVRDLVGVHDRPGPGRTVLLTAWWPDYSNPTDPFGYLDDALGRLEATGAAPVVIAPFVPRFDTTQVSRLARLGWVDAGIVVGRLGRGRRRADDVDGAWAASETMARWCSLAAVVDPALVRSVRAALTDRDGSELSAAAEWLVWHHPAVGRSTPRVFDFTPEFLDDARERLYGDSRARQAARAVVGAVHEANVYASVLVIEEHLIWAAVNGDDAGPHLGALVRMAAKEDGREDLRWWLETARDRLPATVRSHPVLGLLERMVGLEPQDAPDAGWDSIAVDGEGWGVAVGAVRSLYDDLRDRANPARLMVGDDDHVVERDQRGARTPPGRVNYLSTDTTFWVPPAPFDWIVVQEPREVARTVRTGDVATIGGDPTQLTCTTLWGQVVRPAEPRWDGDQELLDEVVSHLRQAELRPFTPELVLAGGSRQDAEALLRRAQWLSRQNGSVKVHWRTAWSFTGIALTRADGIPGVRHDPWMESEATARPERLVAVLGALWGQNQVHLLCGHIDFVNTVVWSPDGTRLATASGDGTARVWDAVTGTGLVACTGHTDWVWAVVWSPDGTRLATASRDGTVRVWDAVTGTGLVACTGHTDWVWAVVWSPDGTRLATASGDGTARVWDAVTGTGLVACTGHTDWVRAVAWSPDGTRLATASGDGTARVWDAVTGTGLVACTGHTDGVRAVVWSPDGTRLATASRDGTVRVWDAVTGTGLVACTGHTDWVWAVVWSPDGTRLATASDDGTARVWDAVTGTGLVACTGHTYGVRAVAWSPDGTRLATASRDGTARVWDAVTGTELGTFTGHTAARSGGENAAVWSPDGTRLATASGDGTARIWESATGSAP